MLHIVSKPDIQLFKLTPQVDLDYKNPYIYKIARNTTSNAIYVSSSNSHIYIPPYIMFNDTIIVPGFVEVQCEQSILIEEETTSQFLKTFSNYTMTMQSNRLSYIVKFLNKKDKINNRLITEIRRDFEQLF